MARTSASSTALTDHDEIRRWAEERGATPSCVRGTGDNNDIGMIRLDFPGYSGEGKLEQISWDEWFDKFDESGLALLVQEKTARGEQSNFNKLVSRETADVAGDGRSSRSQSKSRRRSGSRDEAYEASAEDIDSTDEDMDEDMEEETELEESRPSRRKIAATTRTRSRQTKTTGNQRSRNARSSASSRRSGRQRSRTQKSGALRTGSSKRARVTAGSRSSARSSSSRSRSAKSSRPAAKKAPARVRNSNSRNSRSSSRRRAA